MRKTLIKGILTLSVVFGLSIQAQASDFKITVDSDDSTNGDLEIIEGAADTAVEGDAVSKSLRRVAMAAVGELTLLLQNRIDDLGNLTLDDGSVVALLDGDTISLSERRRGNTVVTITCRKSGTSSAGSRRRGCRPIRICRNNPLVYGEICIDIPPRRYRTTAPGT